jgi:hypothetical protein
MPGVVLGGSFPPGAPPIKVSRGCRGPQAPTASNPKRNARYTGWGPSTRASMKTGEVKPSLQFDFTASTAAEQPLPKP